MQPGAKKVRGRNICKISGCERFVKAYGHCRLHHRRILATGSPQAEKPAREMNAARDRAHFEATVDADTDECVVWPYRKHRFGYGVISTGGRHVAVHAISCERAHGPRPEGMNACHGPCHNPACYNKRHVRWQTQSQNIKDTWRDGTQLAGETAANAKLTDAAVVEIRSIYRTKAATQMELAAKYGVAQSLISRVILRQSWGHVS